MHQANQADPAKVIALRSLIEEFLQKRLQVKLDKLKDGDVDRRQQLIERYRREPWLERAAGRVGQLQLASHTLKPIHPDAIGTEIYVRQPFVADVALIGTHTLAEERRADDVVGNAAALDVFAFLDLAHNGKTVLKYLLAHDFVLAAALSDDADQAQTWIDALATIVTSKGSPSSHTLAKQMYFPLEDGGYHMLAPLFPTTLAHRLYETLQTDRFSEATRNARKARKEGAAWPHGYREYPNLAVKYFGGSNPQNISQLNARRGGKSFLLASMPPVWQSVRLKPPLQQRSVFDQHGAFGRRRPVRELTQVLRKLLLRVAYRNNVRIRETRATLVDDIVDELFLFAAQIQTLPSGWSTGSDCQLDAIESRWLDPGEAFHGDDASVENEAKSAVPADWFQEIASRFANWLNRTISSDRTPMGDEEYLAWKALVVKAHTRLEEGLADEA